MAQTAIPTTPVPVNTPSTYRLAGSCSVRAYVNCDDTPYHLEQPVTRTLPNPAPNHTPERAAKVRELYLTTRLPVPTLVALIDANPSATVVELINLVSQ